MVSSACLIAFNVKVKTYDAFLFDIVNTHTHTRQVTELEIMHKRVEAKLTSTSAHNTRHAPDVYLRNGVYYCMYKACYPGVTARPGV